MMKIMTVYEKGCNKIQEGAFDQNCRHQSSSADSRFCLKLTFNRSQKTAEIFVKLCAYSENSD